MRWLVSARRTASFPISATKAVFFTGHCMTENSFEDLLAETEIDDQTLSQLVRLPMWTPRQAKAGAASAGAQWQVHCALRSPAPLQPQPSIYLAQAVGSPAPEAGSRRCLPCSSQFVSRCPEHTGDRAAPPDRPLRLPCGLWVRMPSGATVRVYREAPEALVRCVLSAPRKSPHADAAALGAAVCGDAARRRA